MARYHRSAFDDHSIDFDSGDVNHGLYLYDACSDNDCTREHVHVFTDDELAALVRVAGLEAARYTCGWGLKPTVESVLAGIPASVARNRDGVDQAADRDRPRAGAGGNPDPSRRETWITAVDGFDGRQGP